MKEDQETFKTMFGITSSSDHTKMSLYELSSDGKVSQVQTGPLTTKNLKLPLVKNIMELHESAAPGSVKGFTKSLYRTGIMEELLSDAVREGVDTTSGESVMHAFYAASFLQNEEASECLLYSKDGKVVGMAQIGKFGRHVNGLSCTISNLVVSPKIDASSQGVILRHVASTAKIRTGEASLITPEGWASAYRSYGLTVEDVKSPPTSPRSQPSSPVQKVVRCHWC